MRHSLRVAALVAVATIPSIAQGQQAGKATSPTELETPLQACLSGGANVTLEVGAKAWGVSKDSGTAYLDKGCGFYVADINIPAAAAEPPVTNPPAAWSGFFFDSGDAQIDKTPNPDVLLPDVGEAACKSSSEYVWIFQKRPNGQFKKLQSYSRTGVWHPGAKGVCSMKAAGDWLTLFNPRAPSTGTDTYRIVERSTRSGKARVVKAGAERKTVPIPP